jgi:hypothetical protein
MLIFQPQRGNWREFRMTPPIFALFNCNTPAALQRIRTRQRQTQKG